VKTAITELFDIRHPIIQGGMHYVAFQEMIGRVSAYAPEQTLRESAVCCGGCRLRSR
jgi:hypothetical protein